jgi:hypothetical protein
MESEFWLHWSPGPIERRRKHSKIWHLRIQLNFGNLRLVITAFNMSVNEYL